MYYDFSVIEDKIITSGATGAKTGSMNYYICRFNFSGNWENADKFAVFISDDKTYTCIIQNNECLLPEELTESKGTVRIGVYGSFSQGDKTVRISTDFAHIIVKEGAYREGDVPRVPTPDLWEQYFTLLDERTAKTTQDTINASLGDVHMALDTIIAQQNAVISIQNELLGGDA